VARLLLLIATIEVEGVMEETFGLQDYSDDQPTSSIDPVCGAKVDESKAARKTGYAGVTYYFCSAACQKRFEEDPGEFIGKRVA
jgi:YHS domain-containing protein